MLGSTMTTASDSLLCPVPGSVQAAAPVSQTALWLQEIQAIGAIATTIGVLIALYTSLLSVRPEELPKNTNATERRSMRFVTPMGNVLRPKLERLCPRVSERRFSATRSGP